MFSFFTKPKKEKETRVDPRKGMPIALENVRLDLSQADGVIEAKIQPVGVFAGVSNLVCPEQSCRF